jgi:hypothetical protein
MARLMIATSSKKKLTCSGRADLGADDAATE